MDTVRLGPFLGMDNRLPDAKLATANGAFLRNAVNVDMDGAGFPRRRQGVAQVLSGTDVHSLWGNGTDAYFVDYGTLYHLSDTLAKTAIYEGLTLGVSMSYTSSPAGVLASNGGALLRLEGASATELTAGEHTGTDVTAKLVQMPGGTVVRYYNGRVLCASGRYLLYSEAFSPALYNPLKGYIPFPAVITVVEPCAGGVYIVADKTYFLTGPMAEASLREVSRATGVPGTGLALDDGTVCWVSDSGLVVGTPSGEVNNVQDKHVAVAPAAAGATLYREQDGMRQLVASLFNPGTSVAAATTYMDAEIVRQGETL